MYSFLTKQDQIFLRWVFVTVGGVMPIDNKEIGRANKLQKDGYIEILCRDNGAKSCKLAEKGKQYFKDLGWTK